MRNLKLLTILFVLVLSVAFSGCTHKNNENTTTEIVEETTTEPIDYNNPLGIEGYTYYGRDNVVNGKDVVLAAKIEVEATLNDKKLDDIILYKCSDDKVVAEYSISEGDTFREIHMFGLKGDTHEIDRDIIVADNFESYTERVMNGITCIYENEKSKKLVKYNDNIEEEYTLEIDENDDMSSGIMTSDCNKLYYSSDGWLKVYNVLDGSTKIIEHNNNMYVDCVNDVLTDKTGTDYVLMFAYMGDLKKYTAILNTVTGELEYLKKTSYFEYLSFEKDVFINNLYDNDSGETSYVVTDKNGVTNKYELQGILGTTSLQILDNGDFLFEAYDNGELIVSLYDGETSEIIGETSIAVPMEDIPESYTSGDYAYIMQTPVYINENELLLCVGDNVNNYLFYIWDVSKSEKESVLNVETYEVSDDVIEAYEDTNAVATIRKTECSEEFMPLKTLADEMEEKYGVDIFVGEESGLVLDIYAIFPLLSYSGAEMALGYLDEELARYPEGFFEQFNYEDHNGIDIYISSSILSTDEDADGLDIAGGVHNTDSENNIIIAIDCEIDPSVIKTTLHHEMAHAIDAKLLYKNEKFDEEWNKLNPGDIYLYSYIDFASAVYDKSLDKYIYDYLYMEDRGAESYFLDNYSLAYPTEDRARVFENFMNKDSWYPDYSELPFIKEKLNFYAKSIREAFDTTGWENVEWERYLID